jgi:uncharacterized protein YbjQ (UPF0145 family)
MQVLILFQMDFLAVLRVPLLNAGQYTRLCLQQLEDPMLVTTTNTLEGKRILEYKGLVAGEAILGANLFRDLFASIRDIVGGRSGSYEKVLNDARQTAIAELTDKAARLGANAVIGVDIDYETVGANGSMLMVTAAGTAVKIE